MKKDELDLNLAKEILDNQNKNLRKAIPQGNIITLMYGIAWMIGYGTLFLTKLSSIGYYVFNICLILAAIFQMIYMCKTFTGIKIVNSKYIAWWGFSWIVGFFILGAIVSSINTILVNIDRSILASLNWTICNSISLLIVSLNFLSGSALFKENYLGVLGIIISIFTIISASMTPIYSAIVCAICGIVMTIFSLFDFYRVNKMNI